jgi:hypothetical protein
MAHLPSGLAFYSRPDERYQMGDLALLRATFDGRLGGVMDLRVYLRNDKPASWYTDIKVRAVDTVGDDITDGSIPGFYWKIAQKDIALSHEEWDQIEAGNTLEVGFDLGNTVRADVVTYIPLWVRIAVARQQRIQRIVDVVLRAEAQETLI